MKKLKLSGIISILFGYHQFLFHPYTVWRSHRIYSKDATTLKHIIVFFLHDIGYITMSMSDMDTERDNHPELGANIVGYLFGNDWKEYSLYHSRDYARKNNTQVSELCWIDKLSCEFDPLWFATIRCFISGELKTRDISKIRHLIVTWREKAIREAKLEI